MISSKQKRKFYPGDLVEVSSNEEGFRGSYFEGIIVQPDGKNKYVVEYKNLVTDDDQNRCLRETVDATEIRPSPPEIPVYDDFHILDQVDAFDNDGWWIGWITGRDHNYYYVYFDESTGETLPYRFSLLRVHQEWYDSKWVPSQKPIEDNLF